MDSEEDNLVTILMNLFNAVHAFTTLQMEITSMIRIYYNNKNIQNSRCLDANYKKSIFDSFDVFLLLLLYFLLCFFKWLFFRSKHGKFLNSYST